MSLSSAETSNFNTLYQAIRQGEVLLLECQLVATGEAVPVICLINREADGGRHLVPCAQLFQTNPYLLVNPPHPERPGFVTQDEVWGTASP